MIQDVLNKLVFSGNGWGSYEQHHCIHCVVVMRCETVWTRCSSSSGSLSTGFPGKSGPFGGACPVPSRPPVPAGWSNKPQCPFTARFNCLSFSSNGKPQSCWCGIQTTACVGVQGLQGVTDCGLTGSATSLHLSFSNRCILAYCQWYLAVQLVAATASAFTPNRMRRSLHGETVWERVAATQKDETHRALNTNTATSIWDNQSSQK